MTKIRELNERFSDLKKLKYINNLLEWDQHVYMPEKSNKGRAELIELVSRITHKKLISNKTQRLIEQAERINDLNIIDSAILREAKREYEKAIKVPTELITELAKTSILAYKAWKEAREKKDFLRFRPYLDKIIELQKEYADKIDIGLTRYDSLIDEFEPGATSEWISEIFNRLSIKLKTILKKLMNSNDVPDQSILNKYYNPKKQWDFSIKILEKLNFDFSIGRQDKSVHPFTVSLSSTDIRITTRIWENFLPACLFGTLHECGHALYDAGFMKEIHNTNLAGGSSLGFHESQSRLWENFIGRSKEFWDYWYPQLQKLFPEHLKKLSKNEFYRSINSVKPSLIRVEADEITYSLHIILRFEIENLIFQDKITTSELPQIWNEKTEKLLNLIPPNDSDGILQDIHWSGGAFGYFPTYTLGNLYAAQLYHNALVKNPHLQNDFSKGNFSGFLNYLRDNIHQYGKIYHPIDLIKKISGENLNPDYFIHYLENKFFPIYSV